jgi:hypothetical protein
MDGTAEYPLAGKKLEREYWVGGVKVNVEEPDLINNPPHYTDGGIETIDFIEAKLGMEGFRAYCLATALKYLSRAGKKGSYYDDIRKAIWYLERIALGEPSKS